MVEETTPREMAIPVKLESFEITQIVGKMCVRLGPSLKEVREVRMKLDEPFILNF